LSSVFSRYFAWVVLEPWTTVFLISASWVSYDYRCELQALSKRVVFFISVMCVMGNHLYIVCSYTHMGGHLCRGSVIKERGSADMNSPIRRVLWCYYPGTL
jgi:hypothetical protein